MRPQVKPQSGKTLHHYVIIRADLPSGVRLAQSIHAAGESSDGPLPTGTYAYALAARDEDHLFEIANRLWDAEIPHKVISEPDAPYDGQAMAIGIWPTYDKERIRKVVSDLPLAK